ncbi:hypothetical protein BASA50_009916 [Batrachochytrium salamandrivorans]|uniref:Uncharacterized protein n=1 Tax=Batrachochytrium salamandrivorans TaxID=1357716 RepID=A0ABQ8EZZ2_9FUNG|nr:hypothetical protein BASA50_009916 [Batrachochytrium salamandrivorans]
MILPLLLLPLVSFGVVAQHPGQRQTVNPPRQLSYRLVFPSTRFTQAIYVCIDTKIKFKTNHAKSLTQEIEKLCKEGIDLIKKGVDIPNDLLDDYDSRKADFENSKKEAEKAYKQWTLAVTRAKNGNGRNRSKEEIQRDYDVANQLVRELVQLKNETDGKYRDMNEKRKVLERMEEDCLRKKKR